MAMTEKIKILLVKRKMSQMGLAKKLNTSAANIYGKMKRDNFSDKELAEIADALDCDFEAHFIMRETGEKV